MKNIRLIALLTDFGLGDPYVGIMKGIIWKIAPDVHIIDLTHAIRPQNITQASFLLYANYCQFPEETIFVCVVDPGVGSERLPVLVQSGGYVFIGPDNGLFGFLNSESEKVVIHLKNRKYFLQTVGRTFHGRDIFAPVAAHLAAKGKSSLGDFGPRRSDLFDIEERFPVMDGTSIRGKIMHIDRFGNLITNIRISHLKSISFDTQRDRVVFRNLSIPFATTFSDPRDDSAHILVGSTDHLEIFVKNGNAEKTLNANIGDPVHVFKHHR